jgi:hypothetical protein
VILFGVAMVVGSFFLAFMAARAVRTGRSSLLGAGDDFDRLSSPEEFWFVVVSDAILALAAFIIGVLVLTVW